jgi:predicted kinase
VLLIFSGLPASGKSTLAQEIAKRTQSVYLRIDTIEQALRDLCRMDVGGEGYRLAYRVAIDNLRLGLGVVADSCNPDSVTRSEWESVAQDAGTRYLNIEIVCSDVAEHRRRVESRIADVAGLNLPNWKDVQNREYHDWESHRIVIDTAGRSVRESADELLQLIRAAGVSGGQAN